MKKLFLLITFVCVTMGVYSQNQDWNIPQRKWFVEIGTPGIGYAMNFAANGPLTNDMDPYFMFKSPTLTAYFRSKTFDSLNYYNGYSVDYSLISGFVKPKISTLNSDYYTDQSIDWTVYSLKIKYRGYDRLKKKLSLTYGIGYSFNESYLSGYNFYTKADPTIYYEVKSISNSSISIVFDIGLNFDYAKWGSIGLAFDYGTQFNVPLKNIYTEYGIYEATCKTTFLTISPTLRFKL